MLRRPRPWPPRTAPACPVGSPAGCACCGSPGRPSRPGPPPPPPATPPLRRWAARSGAGCRRRGPAPARRWLLRRHRSRPTPAHGAGRRAVSSKPVRRVTPPPLPACPGRACSIAPRGRGEGGVCLPGPRTSSAASPAFRLLAAGAANFRSSAHELAQLRGGGTGQGVSGGAESQALACVAATPACPSPPPPTVCCAPLKAGGSMAPRCLAWDSPWPAAHLTMLERLCTSLSQADSSSLLMEKSSSLSTTSRLFLLRKMLSSWWRACVFAASSMHGGGCASRPLTRLGLPAMHRRSQASPRPETMGAGQSSDRTHLLAQL